MNVSLPLSAADPAERFGCSPSIRARQDASYSPAVRRKMRPVRSLDTSSEARDRELVIYRRKTPEQRGESALQFCDDAWAITADGIRLRHPDYDAESVMLAVRRMRLGDDLYRKVWPGAPLVAP